MGPLQVDALSWLTADRLHFDISGRNPPNPPSCPPRFYISGGIPPHPQADTIEFQWVNVNHGNSDFVVYEWKYRNSDYVVYEWKYRNSDFVVYEWKYRNSDFVVYEWKYRNSDF